jgi:hypothetical protein
VNMIYNRHRRSGPSISTILWMALVIVMYMWIVYGHMIVEL